MPDRVVDLRLFRYVLASAEHGSFRRAAAALNVQHPAVSRGVSALEHRLGAKLFERDHAGIRPTAAGERFLEEATLGFDHLQRAMHQVGALQRGEHGQLTVGVSLPFVLLADLFEKFRKDYAGVSVEIVESTSSASVAMVQQRRVDVAFVVKSQVGDAAQLLHLRDEPMVAVLPRGHRLATATSVTLDELFHERFILCAGGLGPDIEAHLVARMAEHGVDPKVHLHRVGLCNLINMVATGFGVTLIVGPPPRAAPDGVALVPLAGQHAMPLHAVWMEANPNPALKALIDIAHRLGAAAAASR